MKVFCISLLMSIFIHAVVLFFFMPKPAPTIYPVEIKFGVVKVTKSVKKVAALGSGSAHGKLSTAPTPSAGTSSSSDTSSTGNILEDSLVVDIKTIYPEMSKMRGEEEEIKVQVSIDSSGKVEKIFFENEPKFPRLKKAVLDAIAKTKFDTIKSVANLKFNFKLR